LVADHVPFRGIKKEIMEYLRTHPESKNTLTQMAKDGGVRSTSVAKKFLRKHLNDLEQKGLIYSTKVVDPVRNIEYVYYTVVPRCSEKGVVGIPPWFLDNELLYREVIVEYYEKLEFIFSFLTADYCNLCKHFGKVDEETDCENLDCENFIEIYRELRQNNLEALIDRGFKEREIEELQRELGEWEKSKVPHSIPHVLEDLTIYLIVYTVYYSFLTACDQCKEARRCLEEGKKWVSSFLQSYVNDLPESDLKHFWESIIMGLPEIRTDLASKYFAPRLMLGKNHNSIRFLKIYEEFKMLPYFYSKVIPISIDLLAVDLVRHMKLFSSAYKKYEKLIK